MGSWHLRQLSTRQQHHIDQPMPPLLIIMRTWLWLTVSVTTVWTQQINTLQQATQDGGSFGWDWQLTPLGDTSTIGQYYVKIPQAEQQVRYAADATGYHGAVTFSANSDHHQQSANFALGPKAIALNAQQNQDLYGHQVLNVTELHPQSPGGQPPVDIYLLSQQYSPYLLNNEATQINTTPNYNAYETNPNNQVKYVEHIHNDDNQDDNSQPLTKEGNNEYQAPIIQVFKDHNCTQYENVSKDIENDMANSKKLFDEVSAIDIHDINDFTLPKPYTYRGAVKFRVETPRPNARNERYYYTTVETPTTGVHNTTQDGIEKLVASTQDLISNEDLLFINHSAEKHSNDPSEDLIKPRSRYNVNYDQKGQDSKTNQITVKAKISKIVSSEVEHLENNREKENILESNSNQYGFAEPIVVADGSYNNFREQIVNNLVSTMVPYMVDGYQIIGVTDNREESSTKYESNRNEEEGLVNVTPRPVNQNYLAPITVALRLLNANDTESFNSLDDHEASDSELISKSVQSPPRATTTVEIQKSIPLEITHINDVEVHEYLEEGRSKDRDSLDVAKSVYNKYMDALKSSKKIQENMSKLLYKYGSSKEESDKNDQDSESQEQLEPSENIQSNVKVDYNDDSNNQRSEHIQYYEDYQNENNKIIQPIIIEKEIPVTKFVNRYIEKKVPYPQEVQVRVPVDRPVPVPVPYEKIVEKPVEVMKYVDKPYPVEVPRPYPVEVKVPYPVHQKVYIDRPVHVPYAVEKVVEKQILHPVPVPTPVGIPYEVPVPVERQILYPVPVDRPVPYKVEVEKPVETVKEVPVPYPVEKRVPYPVHYETKVAVPYPVEKRIPVPVDRIVEKPVTITKVVDRPIHIQVPVPQPVPVPVHVPQPYPVDRVVEKKVPYPVPVDRIVEKKVPYPYPVEKIVEKIVEKPVVVTKYIDKPYPVEKKVPYPVEKIVEKKVPYPVHVPVEVKVPYPVDRFVERHVPVAVYHNKYGEGASETRTAHQYQPYKDERNKRPNNSNQQQIYLAEYYQMLKDRQYENKRSSKQLSQPNWSNQYATSYQYINNTSQDEKKIALSNYLSYLTNSPIAQSKSNSGNYYGPAPPQNQDDWWQNNKNYVVEVNMRRSEREPKVSTLRIEYGGFKPPLIPSTEVDLDGMPINKQS